MKDQSAFADWLGTRLAARSDNDGLLGATEQPGACSVGVEQSCVATVPFDGARSTVSC
jgi:hypothetical protein